MALMLKYKSVCYYCKKECDPDKEKKETPTKRSYLQKTNGKWFAHCWECYTNKKETKRKQNES